ncbi:MAG TPA: glycosyltransferase [Puia sp.]
MPSQSAVQVLVSPLDWGLGHATRCIPIIHALKNRGVTVLIAASGPQMALLKGEFPALEFLEIPGYGIRYSGKKGGLIRGLLFRIPAILGSIRRENTWLKKLCRQRKIDLIISDNRYGLYHKDKYNVFITHQLFIQSGLGNLADRILLRLNRYFIRRFSECWIPDFQDPFSLAGVLSHPPHLPSIPVKYAGILSRFIRAEKIFSNPLLILISGPEPQRTEFENRIFEELKNYEGSAVVLRGLPGIPEQKIFSNSRIRIYNHLASGPLNDCLNSSETVICRSGYSTLMDLARLRKKAILIPTPGQPEQEYLGRYLHEKKWAICVSQDHFNLDSCLKAFSGNAWGFPELPDVPFPEELIAALPDRLNLYRP